MKAVRKVDLPFWLPLRELSSWSDGCRVSWARRRRRSSKASPTGVPSPTLNTRNPRVGRGRCPWSQGCCVGLRAPILVSFTTGLSRPRSPGARILPSTFAYWWQTIEVRVLLCVEEVVGASTSSHLSCHFDGFVVHRDVPSVTSSQQFLDNLARHLRITTLFTIPFDMKEHFSFTQLLVRAAQETHRLVPRAAQDDLGEEVVLGLSVTALGFTTGLWLAAAVPRGWCVERWTASGSRS